MEALWVYMRKSLSDLFNILYIQALRFVPKTESGVQKKKSIYP